MLIMHTFKALGCVCVVLCVCGFVRVCVREHYITISARQPAAFLPVIWSYADADWPNKAPLSVKVWREKPITRVRSEDPGYWVSTQYTYPRGRRNGQLQSTAGEELQWRHHGPERAKNCSEGTTAQREWRTAVKAPRPRESEELQWRHHGPERAKNCTEGTTAQREQRTALKAPRPRESEKLHWRHRGQERAKNCTEGTKAQRQRRTVVKVLWPRERNCSEGTMTQRERERERDRQTDRQTDRQWAKN